MFPHAEGYACRQTVGSSLFESRRLVNGLLTGPFLSGNQRPGAHVGGVKYGMTQKPGTGEWWLGRRGGAGVTLVCRAAVLPSRFIAACHWHTAAIRAIRVSQRGDSAASDTDTDTSWSDDTDWRGLILPDTADTYSLGWRTMIKLHYSME